MEQAFGLEIPRTLEEACDPRRMALVVYDMQVGVLGQLPDAAEVTAQVLELLDAARQAGARVCFTRHMSLPLAFSGASQLRMAMDWQGVDSVAQLRPVFLRDSPAFQLVPELAPRDDEVVVDKIAMSAFVGTPLDMMFRDCGLTAFAICGVATETGIEPTVRHSLDLGYLPIVVADACGYGDREAAERSLATLAFAGGSLRSDVRSLSDLLNHRS